MDKRTVRRWYSRKQCWRGSSAHITQCHSTGNIGGDYSGGICGNGAGYDGRLNITRSYSTGDILGEGSGGITGKETGKDSECVYVRECYSTGKIANDKSGGICGSFTSNKWVKSIL